MSAGLSVPRRWIVVAAATLGMLASFGMTTTIAVFIKPFEDEFGWLRADISFAYALLSAGAALGGLVVGWAFDRIDTRIIVVFGAAVMAFGLVALAGSSDLATVQRIYLAIGVAGFACLYTPLIAVVGLWFDRGRGLAMGIVTAGGAIGQGITPLLVQPMIAAFGWRNTCILLGAGFLVVLAPDHAARHQAGAGRNPAIRRARRVETAGRCRRRSALAGLDWRPLFCCAGMAVPLVHLVSLLTDRGEPIAMSGQPAVRRYGGGIRRTGRHWVDLRSHRFPCRLCAGGRAAVRHGLLVRAAAVPCCALRARGGFWLRIRRRHDRRWSCARAQRCRRALPGGHGSRRSSRLGRYGAWRLSGRLLLRHDAELRNPLPRGRARGCCQSLRGRGRLPSFALA